MELNETQKKVVNSEDKYAIVVSGGGAGKTACLTEKLRHLLDQGMESSKIVAITFTNNAADEIRERLGGKATGMFIGTVHAYANALLCDIGISTRKLLDEERFDELFALIKQHPEAIKPIEFLALDEAQDSNLAQFEFLIEDVHPNRWMLFGDWKQTIFQFGGSAVDYFIDLANSPQVVKYELRENYRCGSNILTFAKNITRRNGFLYEDHSFAASGRMGTVQRINYDLPKMIRYITSIGNYGDWFILCRTNDQVDTINQMLTTMKIPHSSFKRKDLNNDELRQSLEQNTIKVLTIHSAKGLESKNVAVIGWKMYNCEETCISYVAATRAKELLLWVEEKKFERVPKVYKQMEQWE